MTTLNISDGTGDCWCANTGGFDNTATSLYNGKGAVNIYKAWMPFVVTLPKLGIVSATLKVIAFQNDSGTTCKLKIGCEAADNPAAPVSQAQLDARTLTTDYTTDNNVAAWTIGTEYTWDITTAVQEILNRAGWASGQTMAVLIHDNGSSANAQRVISSSEHLTYTEPILSIVYNLGGQVIIWVSQ
jgi:hypothetical protein